MTATHDTPVDAPPTTFSTDIAGLDECLAPDARRPRRRRRRSNLRIAPVVKQIGEDRVRMLAYNGSIPGPTLRVRQGSEISVRVRNDADTEATVHWHGLRLDNKYDGVPHETQDPIAIGGDFTYQVRFPDAGLYWYHPHIREDYGLDMGLYGNLVVDPADPDYWPPVNREFVVTLDDVLIEDGRIAPYNLDGPTLVAMGRFGNVMLTGGESNLELDAARRRGRALLLHQHRQHPAVQRRHPGRPHEARRRRQRPLRARDLRRRGAAGPIRASHRRRAVRDRRYVHASRTDTPDQTLHARHRSPSPTSRSTNRSSREFEELRTSPDLTAERARIDARPRSSAGQDPGIRVAHAAPLRRPGRDRRRVDVPDAPRGRERRTGHLPECGMKLIAAAPSAWTCPMHPEVVSAEPGTCPECGMKLIAAAARRRPGRRHTRTAHTHDTPDGLEWEDLMPEINRASDSCNMIWKLVDRDTGQENWEIDWAFTVGDQVKIRLVNDSIRTTRCITRSTSTAPAGSSCSAATANRDPNLVWKDTVLVRSSETVDILLDVTNPGLWMAHCHIAEHNQSGMMFSFRAHEKE